ncbi:MAG TPA: SOS response-associated peptidase [Burkholderiaceae bacterium]|nr:SOS response-associated peptidase [Burkholderiaceae bacterium]
MDPMCANYAPTRPDRLRAVFGVSPERDDYVDDSYPGHVAPVIVGAGGARRAELAVFGLIPPWSRDSRNFRQCYNARSETVGEKPSFRHAWKSRQWCAVPADGFYEPNYETGKAVRWRIESADDEPLVIAGLWERWRAPTGQWSTSFTMLTINADAHPLMSRFHAPGDEKRSLVLLEPSQLDQWLQADLEQAQQMLRPFDPAAVRCFPAPRPPRAVKPKA